jgi:hypothetical protein
LLLLNSFSYDSYSYCLLPSSSVLVHSSSSLVLFVLILLLGLPLLYLPFNLIPLLFNPRSSLPFSVSFCSPSSLPTSSSQFYFTSSNFILPISSVSSFTSNSVFWPSPSGYSSNNYGIFRSEVLTAANEKTAIL